MCQLIITAEKKTVLVHQLVDYFLTALPVFCPHFKIKSCLVTNDEPSPKKFSAKATQCFEYFFQKQLTFATNIPVSKIICRLVKTAKGAFD